MSAVANAVRGETALLVDGAHIVLRPSFATLVAAEAELGSLLALVERAAAGQLMLAEMVALFWHCVRDPAPGLTRERIGAAVAERGLAAATPVLRTLIGQILQGR